MRTGSFWLLHRQGPPVQAPPVVKVGFGDYARIELAKHQALKFLVRGEVCGYW